MTRPPRVRWRPSVGSALLALAVAALLVPLSGLWVLRLYESALIRQTESELIAQSAVIAAVYRTGWLAAGGHLDGSERTADDRGLRPPGFDGPWTPRFAALDLAADPILPPPPAPVPAPAPADPVSAAAGAALGGVLREAQKTTLAGMRVLDRTGVVVAATGDPAAPVSMAHQEEVARALAGEPVSALRLRAKGPAVSGLAAVFDRPSALRVFVATPVLEGDRVIGAVLLSRTPRALSETLYGKRWHLAGLAAVVLGSVAVLVALGAAAIARPLRAVTRRAIRIAEGGGETLAAPPPPSLIPPVREVEELSAALARMAVTLERRAEYIRDFAAHVSHEFKTPLAAISGTVELLRDHLDEMPAPDRERFLSNLDADARRLSHLVRRLLDLARADVMASGSAAVGAEALDPAPLLRRLAGRYGAAGLTVDLDIPPDCRLPMGEEALETVLVNLFDNARQHAGPAARVTVTLRREGGDAVLTVADDGPGVSAANAGRLFDPFFTTARGRGGTGLGLAIVRSLTAAHGGTAAAVPSPSGGVFVIRLPLPSAFRATNAG